MCVRCVWVQSTATAKESEGGSKSTTREPRGERKKKGAPPAPILILRQRASLEPAPSSSAQRLPPLPLPIVGWPSLAAPFSYLILFNSPPLLLPFSFEITHLWQIWSLLFTRSPRTTKERKNLQASDSRHRRTLTNLIASFQSLEKILSLSFCSENHHPDLGTRIILLLPLTACASEPLNWFDVP